MLMREFVPQDSFKMKASHQKYQPCDQSWNFQPPDLQEGEVSGD